METELHNSPSYTFYQIGEESIYDPINVIFYNGSIELEQGNETIYIGDEFIKKLFKSIVKKREEAEQFLNK